MRQIGCGAHLCLTDLSLMIRYTNIVKDPMQLVNDIVDLGGQITRVDRHSECEYTSRSPEASIKRSRLRRDLAAVAAWRILEWTKWWRMRRNSECCLNNKNSSGCFSQNCTPCGWKPATVERVSCQECKSECTRRGK